ncbi:MAG: hypothetical protein GX957_14680, partial [Clostridiaceae bacterium]|nr:hypothetical protein [Clostridiaceae bacterium]
MITTKLLRLLLCFFIGSFTVISIIVGLNVPFIIFLLYMMVCYLAVIYLKGYPKVLFVFSVFLLAFCLRIAFVLLIKTPPESDYGVMYEAALSFSKRDYSFNKLVYFKDWAYQTGFVIYQGMIARLFGIKNALLAIKIVNAFFSSISCILIYFILVRFVKEEIAGVCALLSAGLIFPATFVTVLSNQHVSAFFVLLGIFFITSKSKKTYSCSILGGVALGISNILRPETIVVLCAVFLVSFIRFVKVKKERKYVFLETVLIVIVYIIVNNIASMMIIKTGVNPEGLKNNNVLWKFVEGLNHESKGGYSKKDADLIYDGIPLTDEQKMEVQIKLIKERLGAGPKKLASLFLNKQYTLWAGDPTIWTFKPFIDTNKSVKILGNDLSYDEISLYVYEYHKLQMFILILLSIWGAVYQIRKPHKSHFDFMLYYIMLLSIAGIYLFIEVQARYVYLPEVLLIITSAKGIEALWD